MPNWFLLADALAGHPARDWADFAGPGWAATTRAYAERLAAHTALAVTWVVSPPLAIAVKHLEGGQPRVAGRGGQA